MEGGRRTTDWPARELYFNENANSKKIFRKIPDHRDMILQRGFSISPFSYLLFAPDDNMGVEPFAPKKTSTSSGNLKR
jgi:hypothetical protein